MGGIERPAVRTARARVGQEGLPVVGEVGVLDLDDERSCLDVTEARQQPQRPQRVGGCSPYREPRRARPGPVPAPRPTTSGACASHPIGPTCLGRGCRQRGRRGASRGRHQHCEGSSPEAARAQHERSRPAMAALSPALCAHRRQGRDRNMLGQILRKDRPLLSARAPSGAVRHGCRPDALARHERGPVAEVIRLPKSSPSGKQRLWPARRPCLLDQAINSTTDRRKQSGSRRRAVPQRPTLGSRTRRRCASALPSALGRLRRQRRR
jgi:hypothetical protein